MRELLPARVGASRRPVHVGETVTAHFVIREVDRAKHRLTIDSWIENAAGERVVEGTCEAGFLRA